MIDVNNIPDNLEIYESFVVANSKLGRYDENKIMVSISGGADSDIMLDLIHKINPNVHFVFFDTGIEYTATKEHLKYLEQKYNIKIEIEKAVQPVPLGCRKHGQPFVSKYASEMIERLQRHNFKWENEDFETLYKRYPKCKAALRWWCNEFDKDERGHSKFNISYNKHLKEFMIENPPTFKISNKCCKGAKKDVAKKYKIDNDIQLSLVGVRKAEGGARSSLPNCFTAKSDAADEYRPIFWYKNDNKKIYEEYYNIKHSRCYSEYGLDRTGCAGCPFGKNFEKELEVIEKYEPKLLNAVNKIFGDSYEYTRKYKEFAKQKEKERLHNDLLLQV